MDAVILTDLARDHQIRIAPAEQGEARTPLGEGRW
jgi:hypothetical protein